MVREKEYYQFCHEIDKNIYPEKETQPEEEVEEKSDTTVAWVLTSIWIAVILILPFILFVSNDATYKFSNLKLNEVGDYLAGFAAPLAFFWLVYGYHQQGKELKLNNKTLKLQHEELKNSVIAQQNQALSMEKQLKLVIREKFYPKFKLTDFEYIQDEQYIEIHIFNDASAVYSAEITILSDDMILDGEVNQTSEFIDFSLQTTDNIVNKFSIVFQLSFSLEIGERIEQYYKIDYNALTHNALTKPNLEITKLEEEL